MTKTYADRELDLRLKVAIATKADPKVVSPRGAKFAWRPVYGWDYRAKCHRRLWLERVNWFMPLGLVIEYFTYAGSEKEFHDIHGIHSWEKSMGRREEHEPN